VRLFAAIIMFFCFIQPPSMLLDSPAPEPPWFIEHFSLKPFDFPPGVSANIVIDDHGFEYLVIKNYSSINLFVVSEPYEGGTNRENINVELPPGFHPQFKVVDGQAYYWRNGWRNGRSTISEGDVDSIWLSISDNSIRCNSDRVLELEPLNRFSSDRPKDVKIPESQEALLPIVYGNKFIYIPLTISYTLNEKYHPTEALNIAALINYALVALFISGIIIFVLSVLGFLKWVEKRASQRNA
jgi:hypothetical protein